MVGVAKQRLNTVGAKVVDMDEVGALVVIDTGDEDGPVERVGEGNEVGEFEFTKEVVVDGEIEGPTEGSIDGTEGMMDGPKDGSKD